MAAIDKIYMNKAQVVEFMTWAVDNQEECYILTGCHLLDYIYASGDTYIVNFPERVDWFLYNNCPLQFVKDRLKEQYNSHIPENSVIELADFLIKKFDTIEEIMNLLENLRSGGTIDDVYNYLFDIKFSTDTPQ